MRKIRKFGTALTLAAVVATGMMASSTSLYAAGPGTGGTSQGVLCGLLEKAIASTTATFGADSAIVASLQARYEALGCTAE